MEMSCLWHWNSLERASSPLDDRLHSLFQTAVSRTKRHSDSAGRTNCRAQPTARESRLNQSC